MLAINPQVAPVNTNFQERINKLKWKDQIE